MGKQGQLDFLGVGSGIDAWEAFAKDFTTHMRDATSAKLQQHHFLVAEIGLTTKTLVKKFQDNATSLTLMHSLVSRLQSCNIPAVKCLVYDGADAQEFADSDYGRKFLDEGGILINVPYLCAETILAKFDETAKLREEIAKLREEIAKNQAPPGNSPCSD
jgi:hypothetical protein